MEIEEYGLQRKALKRYLILMDKGEYFEAQEVLEEVWHPLRKSDDPLRNPVKGLINAAVAFEHIKRGRRGAQERARAVISSFDRRCTGDRSGMAEAELFGKARSKVLELKEKHEDIFSNHRNWEQ